MEQHYKKIEKIVVNIGIGRLSSQPHFEDKLLPEVIKELSAMTGQKPSERTAKKSIAGFKLRTGTVVGLKVTLRGQRLKHFLAKLVSVVLPRVRDFRGLPLKSVDKNGNLTIGLKEHWVFPEIIQEVSKVNFGVEMTLVPKLIANREAAIELYRTLKIPFQKETKKK